MNFLRRGEGGLTYKGAVYIMILWVCFLGVVYGLQFIQYLSVKSDVKSTKVNISQLVREKDEQIDKVRKIRKDKGGLTAQESLEGILTERPRWSRVISSLARALPADVWLSSVKVEGGGEDWYAILIRGEAKSQRSLTNFILKLESSGLFNKTALGKTKLKGKGKEGAVISYELSTQPVLRKLIGNAET